MRQIPLPEALARLIESYVVEFRTDQPHAFLLDSAERRALSAASLAAILHRAAAQLSDEAMRSLSSRSKQTVTPHDLRHTSAVVRLKLDTTARYTRVALKTLGAVKSPLSQLRPPPA